MVKKRFGPYSIVTPLYDGDFGTTYVASRKLGKGISTQVILKVLSTDNPSILQEMHVLTRLDHPCLIKILDILSSHKKTVMIYEYVQGWDLNQLLEKLKGATDLSQTEIVYTHLKILEDVLSALFYLYDNRIVHGDVHPRNIRITPFLGIKVIDFGTCQKVAHGSHVRAVGLRPNWSPPEKEKNHQEHSSSDFYTFSKLVLYMAEMFPFLKTHKMFLPCYTAATEVISLSPDGDLDQARVELWQSLYSYIQKSRHTAESEIHLDRLQKTIQSLHTLTVDVPTIALPHPSHKQASHYRWLKKVDTFVQSPRAWLVSATAIVVGVAALSYAILTRTPSTPTMDKQAPSASSPNKRAADSSKPDPNPASPAIASSVKLVVQARPWAKITIGDQDFGTTPVITSLSTGQLPATVHASYKNQTQTRSIKLSDVPQNPKTPIVISFTMTRQK